MATYAQLQAESWWGREVVTPEMDWLGDELCRRTKRPRGAAGTKGDNAHLKGSHRSQEWILKSRYCTSRTYTVQSGLTSAQARHVAGFDFTPGSDSQMIAQCKRIYAAMRAGQLDEVREFYGNVNGDRVVDGWDNVRDRTASSDSSHLWHWHLGIDRRHCANRSLMERIVAVALGDPLEEDMPLTDDDATRVARAVLNQKLGRTDRTVQTELMRVESLENRMTAFEGRPPVQPAPVDVTTLVELLKPELLAVVREEVRDAVADLGEGGAQQVRGPQS